MSLCFAREILCRTYIQLTEEARSSLCPKAKPFVLILAGQLSSFALWHIYSSQALKMMNSSGNFTGCQPQPVPAFIPIFLSFFFFIGFALNCISLWIFWFKVKPWTSMVVLQFNLALSDAIITPAAPLLVIYYITDHWTFGLFFCQFKVFLLSTHTYGSIYFLTLISMHRYFIVVPSPKSQAFNGKPFITKLCLFVWGCLLCQGIPFFFAIKVSEVHGVMKCLSIHQTDQTVLFFAWNWVILFTGLLIPFSITLICYALLIQYILKVNPMNSLSKVMVSKSVQTILISLIIFIICYIPSHITRSIAVTITLFFPTLCSLLESVEVAFYITWIMSGTNCYMDPILYCFTSERFNSIFTSWCPCLQRRHQNITDFSHDNTDKPPLDTHGPLPTNSITKTCLSGSVEGQSEM
ncbi:P2Y purinoceptor 4-like [Lithobates pipiens]